MSVDRIYERHIDEVIVQRLRSDDVFAGKILGLFGILDKDSVVSVSRQTRHRDASGTIDVDIRCKSGRRFIIENKIDAGYSVTRHGDGQPERYLRTVSAYREAGQQVSSVLIAPRKYLQSSKSACIFEYQVEYEQIVDWLSGDHRFFVERAIAQAELPYEPLENIRTGEFFSAYRAMVMERFPILILKTEPNSKGIRPDDSRTIYFDVKKTLAFHGDLPVPRMSLQCLDQSVASASVKIMIGGWGRFCSSIPACESLKDLGAYLRPAGRSLGIVIDTPRLETQQSLAEQLDKVVEGLEAALRLQHWWEHNANVLRQWQVIVEAASGRSR
ncbi:MAG: hypothetical protein ACT4O6_18675 [Reyranella sp.]